MKYTKILLAVTILILSPHVFGERIITVDVAGTLSSSATTNYDGSITYSNTCIISTLCCFSYTKTVPDIASPNAEQIEEGDQAEGTTILLYMPGFGLVSGDFIYYDNQPVPGGNLLDRTYIFKVIPY